MPECAMCGRYFEYSSFHSYCSRGCYRESLETSDTIFECPICGKSFEGHHNCGLQNYKEKSSDPDPIYFCKFKWSTFQKDYVEALRNKFYEKCLGCSGYKRWNRSFGYLSSECIIFGFKSMSGEGYDPKIKWGKEL